MEVLAIGACSSAIHTCLILAREKAQEVGYIAFLEVTPPLLTGVPQIHTSVKALRPYSSKVKKLTCEVLDDAVILNGERHSCPSRKNMYYPTSKIYSKVKEKEQVQHSAQARRAT